MRLAIIDIGTNSARLDVHEITTREQPSELLHREKIVLRLGREIYRTGGIDASGYERLMSALGEFHSTIQKFGAERIEAVGTSALRDASNSAVVIADIKKRFNFPVRVISGDEEASLIAHGVMEGEKLSGSFALIDIGGGSTEICVCSGSDVVRCQSFEVGALRVQERFLKSIPPDFSEGDPVEKAASFVRSIVEPSLSKWTLPEKVLGSSGTIKSLARLEISSPGKVRASDLRRLIETMTPMPLEQLRAIPKMEDKRVDIVLAGSILLNELLSIMKVEEIQSTEFSLRDGLLAEVRASLS